MESKLLCNFFTLSSLTCSTASQNQQCFWIGFVQYFWINADFIQVLLYVLSYCIDRSVCIDSKNLLKFLVMIDDWLWMLIEHVQSFLYDFLIIIRSSTWLSSMQKSFHQFIFLTIEIQNCLQVNPFCHNFLPYIHVLLASWEAIQ